MYEYKFVKKKIQKTFTNKKQKEQEVDEIEQLINEYAAEG
ncbi:DUF4177 domain-containing protein [Alkaliphilus sp. MSJ-5]|uniref:DUF4177 domain-containing protein n=1 Tax=Alkaliphilus flagellatus TaxID=2841507 RepID=A0ABS6G3M4_9FIRM|nr:DUF4177 domain-containing protein [Alkaliphilus flagellatus]MBU5677082.1 DUF4177 domain-containing protein [Alkaliphilus flagellatus]